MITLVTKRKVRMFLIFEPSRETSIIQQTIGEGISLMEIIGPSLA